MNNPIQSKSQIEDQLIDLKDTFVRMLSIWPVILVCAFAGYLSALAINRYAKNVYEIKTLLAVQESNNPLGVNENLTLAFNNNFACISSFSCDTRLVTEITPNNKNKVPNEFRSAGLNGRLAIEG